jgi:hypothetical protein
MILICVPAGSIVQLFTKWVEPLVHELKKLGAYPVGMLSFPVNWIFRA